MSNAGYSDSIHIATTGALASLPTVGWSVIVTIGLASIWWGISILRESNDERRNDKNKIKLQRIDRVDHALKSIDQEMAKTFDINVMTKEDLNRDITYSGVLDGIIKSLTDMLRDQVNSWNGGLWELQKNSLVEYNSTLLSQKDPPLNVYDLVRDSDAKIKIVPSHEHGIDSREARQATYHFDDLINSFRQSNVCTQRNFNKSLQEFANSGIPNLQESATGILFNWPGSLEEIFSTEATKELIRTLILAFIDPEEHKHTFGVSRRDQKQREEMERIINEYIEGYFEEIQSVLYVSVGRDRLLNETVDAIRASSDSGIHRNLADHFLETAENKLEEVIRQDRNHLGSTSSSSCPSSDTLREAVEIIRNDHYLNRQAVEDIANIIAPDSTGSTSPEAWIKRFPTVRQLHYDFPQVLLDTFRKGGGTLVRTETTKPDTATGRKDQHMPILNSK